MKNNVIENVSDKFFSIESFENIFGKDAVVSEISPLLFAQSVRTFLQNGRQGTVFCKGRSDVTSRSNLKPWRQKGTGRARAGSPRSPLWRGGGKSHGPQGRGSDLVFSKKSGKLSKKYILQQYVERKKVISLSYDPKIISCKESVRLISEMGIQGKKILFLHAYNDFNTICSFNNINFVSLVSYDAISAYAVASVEYILFLEKDRNEFLEVVKSWA